MTSYLSRKSRTPSVDKKDQLTDDQKHERACRNWKILRGHIKEMNTKVNYLVQTLDEANEARQQQNMTGFDYQDKGANYLDKSLNQQGKTEDK